MSGMASTASGNSPHDDRSRSSRDAWTCRRPGPLQQNDQSVVPGFLQASLETRMLFAGATELTRRPRFGRMADENPRPDETLADDTTSTTPLPAAARPITRGSTRATSDEAAALFDAFADRIRRYVAFRVRSAEDADDLTSEVFRRVLSGPIPIDMASRPAWLFRVAHNAIIDHYRRRRFLAPLDAILDRADDAPTLPERAMRDEETRRV